MVSEWDSQLASYLSPLGDGLGTFTGSRSGCRRNAANFLSLTRPLRPFRATLFHVRQIHPPPTILPPNQLHPGQCGGLTTESGRSPGKPRG